MRRKSRLKLVFACLAAVVLAMGLVACGDEETQSLTYTIAEEGKELTVSAPDSAESGLAEITLTNESKDEGDVQLIRAEGDHSTEEVIKGLEKAMEGGAFPEWFFAGGGVSSTPAGESQTVTQVLEPGTYYAFVTENSEGPPKPDSVPATEVNGDEVEEELEADETVSAFEYGFDTEELSSGATEIAFDNTGAQPHHLIAAPLLGENTAKDVESFFKSNEGKPPFAEKGTKSTAVIEGGESQLVTLDLEPGRYVLFCFISDRKGGPPHALKGMVDEVEVK